MNKFEKLIEYIINDEDQKARELFHDIVVEKSRDIYESIMDEENMEEKVHGDQPGDLLDEIGADESHAMENDEEGEEFAVDGEEDGFAGDEEGSDEFGGEEAGEDEIEDKVMNIDAKLDELLAKFDEIMGDEGHDDIGGEEPEMGHDEPAFGGDEESHEEEPEMFEAKAGSGTSGSGKSGSGTSGSGKSGSGASGKSGKSGKPFESRNKSTTELMREYVDRIGDIYGGPGDAAEGQTVGTGTGSPKKVSVNTKYSGKQDGPDFGGKAVKTDTAENNQDGTSPTKASNEYTKGEGQVPVAKKNVNVPGGTAGKTSFKNKEGSYETDGDSQGSPTGKMAGTGARSEKQGEKNAKSPLVQNAGKK